MKLNLRLLAGALALAPITQAQAAPEGWYVDLGVGASWMSGKADFASLPDTTLSYQGAARVSGAAGYKWNNWRAELEPNWVTNDAGLVGFHGGTTVASLMANGSYDFQLDDRWTLSAGAGVGVARVSHNVFQDVSNGLLLGGHDTGMAWQLIAGAGYALRYNAELDVEYRYMNTGNTGAVSMLGPVRFQNGQNNIVMASMRWFPFATQAVREVAATPAPPPPAPPPRILPAPPPPPPVQTFVVFFDFDKSDLTADARQVVAQAVQVAKKNNFVHITVTGHTDTAGSGRYNQKLSERRAATVKTAMVDQGLRSETITTIGRGFNDLLVPTAPGVREPRNRRVVIDTN